MNSMKRFLGILLLFIPFFFSVPVTFSQEEFDYQKAYKDYIYTFELYKKAHSDYLLAKSQYNQAKTLASQTKARDVTAIMLEKRDEVVITYFTTLRMLLSESDGITDAEKQGLFIRIDSEVAWFKNHKSQIPSAGTLADLSEDSLEAAEHFVLTKPLIYEVLLVIPVGKIEIFKTEASSILDDIKNKTEKVRQKGDHDTTKIERWIIETQNKLTRSIDKEVAAQANIASIQSGNVKDKDLDKVYNETISLLQESNQFLREASQFMKEIVKEFKEA